MDKKVKWFKLFKFNIIRRQQIKHYWEGKNKQVHYKSEIKFNFKLIKLLFQSNGMD